MRDMTYVLNNPSQRSRVKAPSITAKAPQRRSWRRQGRAKANRFGYRKGCRKAKLPQRPIAPQRLPPTRLRKGFRKGAQQRCRARLRPRLGGSLCGSLCCELKKTKKN